MSIFSTETIVLQLAAKDKQDALTQLAKRIEAAGKLQPGGFDNYMLSLLKREGEFSTAVGYNYAIPHGKSPAVVMPAVAFARLTQPILWDEEEDDWAENLFMIAVPAASAGDEHIKILTKLAAAIMDDDFREHINQAKDANEVLDIMHKFTA
ncbi:PTS sugar transporter subunit IIA [Superficieibacter sp. 1612_C1]|uniref:PTS sugar transporter subunit IIA n=1 Tax=Superficieibacter sp. 1612_C1 TaxID=2780382 RepID=UPI00188447A2|nr:PTS sugar transporter subunit IIA [Superficieibacter sp. 1612_C1]